MYNAKMLKNIDFSSGVGPNITSIAHLPVALSSAALLVSELTSSASLNKRYCYKIAVAP